MPFSKLYSRVKPQDGRRGTQSTAEVLKGDSGKGLGTKGPKERK